MIKILNLFIVVLVLVACAPVKHDTPPFGIAPPLAERQFENPLDQAIYEDLNYEKSYTNSPCDTRSFDATCYILDANKRLVGTGALIDEDIVLTAAHVANHVYGGYVSFIKNGDTILIEDIWLQPEWGLAPEGMHDIALLRLSCYVDDIEPITMASKGVSIDRYGSNIATIGCSLGYKKQSKPLRIFYYGTLTSNPAELKLRSTVTGIWFGDSGGPVIMFNVDGSVILVGIIVRFTIYQGDVMDFTATDVRQYTGELEAVMEGWVQQ